MLKLLTIITAVTIYQLTLNNENPELAMRYKTDNSIQERLRRIKSGRDSNNWLTEAPSSNPSMDRSRSYRDSHNAAKQKYADSAPTQPTQERTPEVADPNESPLATRRKTADPVVVPSRAGGFMPFKRGVQAPVMDKVKGAMGPFMKMYENGVKSVRDKINFANKNSDYPTQEETQEDIQNYAGHAMLYARELQRESERGAGTKSPSRDEIQALMLNRERNLNGFNGGNPEMIRELVQSSRPLQFTPEFIESTFNLVTNAIKKSGTLPKKYQDGKFHAGLQGADPGKAVGGKKSKDTPLFYKDEPSKQTTKPERDLADAQTAFMQALEANGLGDEIREKDGSPRARMMWKIFLEQGGRDAYTGLPLSISNMQLEHLMPFQQKPDDLAPDDDKGDETRLDRAQARDTDDNFVIINKGVNNLKSDLSMEDFYKKVESLSGLEDKDFQFMDEKGTEANNVLNDYFDSVLPTVINDKQFVDGDHFKNFRQQINDHESMLDELQGEVLGFTPALDDFIKDKNLDVPSGYKGWRKGNAKGKGGNRNAKYDKADPSHPKASQFKEFDDKLEEMGFNAEKRLWTETRGNSIGSLKPKLTEKAFKNLGLRFSMSRRRGGTSVSPGTLKRVLDDMLQDPNIMKPERLDQWKKMYSYAFESGLNQKDTKKKNESVTEALESIGYNPDHPKLKSFTADPISTTVDEDDDDEDED